MRMLSFLLLIIFTSCAATNKKNVVTKEDKVVQKKSSASRVKKTPVKKLVKKYSTNLDLKYEKKYFYKWKNFFLKKDKSRFLRYLSNAYRYEKIIKNIFRAENLPEDLFYVGLIESGYYSRSRSHAGAAGPWQFIRGTGRTYGLKINSYVDERYNIFKATKAAAAYFKDLYNIFGNWELALAAYNAGEYGIMRRIKKANSRSFSVLAKKRMLPRETINYVPKVAAAKAAAFELRKKFKKNVWERNLFYNAKKVSINRSFTRAKLARAFGVSYSQLKKLNPDLKRSWISVRRVHDLIVPSNAKISSKTANYYIGKGPVHRVTNLKKPFHIVRRGEYLSKIARKYGLSVRTLKRLNGLRSDRIKIGQKLNVGAKRRTIANTTYYKVKKGEFLAMISKRFGVSISQLKSWNKLKRSKIYIGQRLRVRGPEYTYHKVKRGEHLTLISKKYGITIRDIKKYNSLRRNTLFIGQKLKIPSDAVMVVKN